MSKPRAPSRLDPMRVEEGDLISTLIIGIWAGAMVLIGLLLLLGIVR